jgi:hypothetical protein
MSIEEAPRRVIPVEGQSLSATLEIPEALQGKIPYPKSAKNTRTVINTYRMNWKRAADDLRALSQTQEMGPPIASFFDVFPEEGILAELSTVLPLIGLNDSTMARQVRSDLKLARMEGEATDHTFWRFSKEEMAQYMTGLIARKKVNYYASMRRHPEFFTTPESSIYNPEQ